MNQYLTLCIKKISPATPSAVRRKGGVQRSRYHTDFYDAWVSGSDVIASSTVSAERAAEIAAIKEKAVTDGYLVKNADEESIENHGIKLQRQFSGGDARFIAEWQYQPHPEKEAA